MTKRHPPLPIGATLDPFEVTPATLLEPWLNAQRGVIDVMKDLVDHWYARRTGDLAALQDAVACFTGCHGPEDLIAAQSRCAAMLSERLVNDFAGLQADVASFTTAFGQRSGADTGAAPPAA